jgi:hypothetical protein
VVLLLCVVAAWRVRRPQVDRGTARLLGLGALAAIAVAGVGREFHGRPSVSVFQLVELAAILAFVAWASYRVGFRRPGAFTVFAIAVVALWEGLSLLPTLTHGFVLIALPAFVARLATVLALGAATGLLLLMFRLYDQQDELSADRPYSAPTQRDGQDEDAWELA